MSTTTGLTTAAFLALASVAGAQEAVPGALAGVIVERASTGELRGHLLELGPETLTLLVDGQRLSLPLAEVLRVDSGNDPVRNGAVIGAIVGGAWCALVCGQALDGPGALPVGVAINAVFFAGIGAGIDAMIPGRNTIYRRAPPTSASRRAAVSYRLRF
jgi:hypothetical protein